jgi:two-component sensor histidine kinase
MGLVLVDMLVNQLNGMIEISNAQGTSFAITFKKPFYKPRLDKKETGEKYISVN